MKKILNLPIAILLLSSLVSCGNSKPQAKTPEQEREVSINAAMDEFFEFISSETNVSASPDVQKNLKTAINKIVNTLLKEKENIQKSINSIKPDFITFQSEVNAFIEDDNTQNFLNSLIQTILNSLIQTIKKSTPDDINLFSKILSEHLKNVIPSDTQNNLNIETNFTQNDTPKNEKINYEEIILNAINSLNLTVNANFKKNTQSFIKETKTFINQIFRETMKPEYENMSTAIKNIIITTFNDTETIQYFNQIIEFITTPSTIAEFITEELSIVKKNDFKKAKKTNPFLKAFFYENEQNTKNYEQSTEN